MPICPGADWVLTYCVCQNRLGCGWANAEDVLQRELDPLLVGDIHTSHTRSLYPQRRPLP